MSARVLMVIGCSEGRLSLRKGSSLTAHRAALLSRQVVVDGEANHGGIDGHGRLANPIKATEKAEHVINRCKIKRNGCLLPMKEKLTALTFVCG